MIRGIYLANSADMEDVTLPKVLSEFNVLQEFKDLRDNFDGQGYKMVRREFWTSHYYIVTYGVSTNSGYEAMWKIFNCLHQAIPEFFCAWKFTESTLLLSWPRYCNISEDLRYREMLDEMIRFSTWCSKEFPDPDEAVTAVRDYFDMCVSHPGNRK